MYSGMLQTSVRLRLALTLLFQGTYSEQVTIAAQSAALTIYGYTTDTTSYTSNVVTVTHSSSLLSGAASDEATGTIINLAANCKIYNINIKNSYGKGSQAIALAAYVSSHSVAFFLESFRLKALTST